MMSIGIGEEKILYEYVFSDFTHIDMSFIEGLINTR
jgi:hypothetical protein